MKLILGVDPGMSGAAAVVSADKSFCQCIIFKKHTLAEISTWLAGHREEITLCFIEGVNAMPAQGVSSTFKFGMNYGIWQGLLTAHGIPFERVYPLKWQTAMSCRTGGNKNISKARAQELFPRLTITHANADSLLIAEYGRRSVLHGWSAYT
jgi:hypothetical protein